MANPLIERLQALPKNVVRGGKPATAEEFAELERDCDVTFPDDYRELFTFRDGLVVTKGPTILGLSSIQEMEADLGDEAAEENMPGMIIIGTDGGGKAYYYDPMNKLGKGPFAVFMVSYSALDADHSIFLGGNITEVIERVLAGDDFSTLPWLRAKRAEPEPG